MGGGVRLSVKKLSISKFIKLVIGEFAGLASAITARRICIKGDTRRMQRNITTTMSPSINT